MPVKLIYSLSLMARWVFRIFLTFAKSGPPQYILWSMSPPTSWNCSRLEKKLTFKLFFYFFLRHSFLRHSKSIGFLLQNHQNLLKTTKFPDDNQQVDFYILFFLSDKGKKPLSGSVDHHRIYWEWPHRYQRFIIIYNSCRYSIPIKMCHRAFYN